MTTWCFLLTQIPSHFLTWTHLLSLLNIAYLLTVYVINKGLSSFIGNLILLTIYFETLRFKLFFSLFKFILCNFKMIGCSQQVLEVNIVCKLRNLFTWIRLKVVWILIVLVLKILFSIIVFLSWRRRTI